MDIAILLFDHLTALDAIGPYEVLHRPPGHVVKFVAQQPGPKRDEASALTVYANHGFDEVQSADVLLVPGGHGTRPLMSHGETLDWIRAVDKTTTWTTSVCTGSLLLGAAGLLQGRAATTHWMARDLLDSLGAEPTELRVVFDEKYVTAAGVSAGIDMALTLLQKMYGDGMASAVQLGIEYDPQPPLSHGSPRTAPPDIVEFVRTSGLTQFGQ